MARLTNPIQFYNDEKGRSLKNAKLYFYESGTFNVKDTYSDVALTSVNPNPVVADGAGRFPNIFMGSGSYRLVLEDEDGVEIATKDDVANIIGNGEDISTALNVTTATGTQTVRGALDDRVIKRQNVAAAIATPASIGTVIETNTYAGSGGGNRYEVVAGGTETADGGSFIDMDNGNQLMGLFPGGVYEFEHWGAKSDGTDSLTPLNAAKTFLDAKKLRVTGKGQTFTISAPYELPEYGVIGDIRITGATLTITRNRFKFKQTGGQLYGDKLHITGANYAKLDHIRMDDVLLIDGNAPDFGTFWNEFGLVVASIQIDVGDAIGQSVNQNHFCQVRGGLHIFGGSASNPNPQECDQNTFDMIDTTASSITAADGTTGWAMLNESYLNQRNIIKSWYSEGAGNKAVRGNFHVLSAYVDTAASPYAIPPTAHVLFNPDHSIRNRGDFFAGNPKANLITGGCWDLLDAGSKGQPIGFSSAGGFPGDVVADATEPTGIGYAYGASTTTDFQSIRLALTNSITGNYCIWFWIKVVSGGFSLQIENNGSPVTYDPAIYHDAGNGWRLYRISGPARSDGSDDILSILTRKLTDPACEIYVGAAWASNYKTSFLPSYIPPEERVGVTTTGAVVKADALPVGGRVRNYVSTLTTGNTAEWVKNSAGNLVALITVP